MSGFDIRGARRLLIRSPNWLGDAAMALPAMKALCSAISPLRVCVVCRKGLGDIFTRYGFIDGVEEFAREEEGTVHRKLSEEGYDAIFLFTNSFRSAWNGLRAGCRARVGFSGNFRYPLLTHPVRRPKGVHMTDYYMEIVRRAGGDVAARTIDFPLLEDELAFAFRIEGAEGAIGLPLGARYGSAKCWPLKRLLEFVSMVVEKTARNVVLFGTMHEFPQGEEIARLEPGRIINLAGKTSVGEMAAVMARCHTVVANDSGPMHIASLLRKRTIALFGSTDPEQTAPLYENVKVISRHAECSPCFKRECPTDFRCMLGIKAEEVFEEIE